MKHLRTTLLAVALLAASLTASPATGAAGSKTQGCIEKSWGYRCFYGPIHVEASSGQDTRFVPTPPEAGFITSLYATLVDEQGTPVDRHAAHLHHIVFGNPNKDDLTCTAFPFDLVDRFFAVGKERSRLQIPEGYGYYWDNNSPPGYPDEPPTWAMVHHIMGMHEGYESDVFVRLDVGFVPMAEAEGMTDVRPVWLDVENCTYSSTFDVGKGDGAGGVYRKRWNYQMPIGGRFVTFGGHLHDGGLKLRLDNSTTGERVFVSEPTYAENSRWFLKAMTTYSALPGIQVAAGDELQLTAHYDSSRKWHDVMGIMMAYLIPDP